MPAGADHATQVIAQQVYRLRKSREWTAQQLADEMTKAGVKWDRQVVAKLENNRRQAVTVAELLALGQVFGVPPTALLFPVGRQDTVEVLPGREIDTWTAARWFMGDERSDEYDPAGTLTGDPDEWQAATAPIKLSRSHDNLIAEYEWAITESSLFSPTEDDPERRKQQARAQNLLNSLRSVRAQMRRQGMKPPVLVDHLSHVDDKRHVWLTPEQADEVAAEHPGALTMVVYRPEV